jgi:hypothetical protein
MGIGAGIIAIGFFILAAIINLQPLIKLPSGQIFTTNASVQIPYLIVGSLATFIALIGFWFSARKQVFEGTQLELPVNKCDDCQKDLKRTDEHTLVSINDQKFEFCKECMTKRLNKQEGVCPQCKEPLKWNGNLREFLDDWYHAKCLFELQQGHHIKETTKEVVVKVRCHYCNNTFLESLDRCPHCGAKN